MAQVGKFSSKKSSPSYFMAILGVSLVLFFLGMLGWIGINSNKLVQYFRESVEVQIILRENTPEKDRKTQDSRKTENSACLQGWSRAHTTA